MVLFATVVSNEINIYNNNKVIKIEEVKIMKRMIYSQKKKEGEKKKGKMVYRIVLRRGLRLVSNNI